MEDNEHDPPDREADDEPPLSSPLLCQPKSAEELRDLERLKQLRPIQDLSYEESRERQQIVQRQRGRNEARQV